MRFHGLAVKRSEGSSPFASTRKSWSRIMYVRVLDQAGGL